MHKEIYAEIKNALANSEAGISLQNTLRWSEYRNGETEREWIVKVGITGQDFLHTMVLMPGIAKAFLEHEGDRFTPAEKETLSYGIVSHDWGEAKINGRGVGDVSAMIKSMKDEKVESWVARRVITSLDLPENIKGKLLDGYAQVVEGGNPKLYDAFKALERSEYVITAMKAYVNCKRLNALGKPGIKNEEALVGRVLIINLAKVLDEHVPNYPNSIGLMFKRVAPLIDDMFAHSLPWLSENPEWQGKRVDHKALAEAFMVKWEAFKSS